MSLLCKKNIFQIAALVFPIVTLKPGSPFGGCQAKRHNQVKRSGEGRIYYLQQGRRVDGIFPQAVSP